MSGVAIDYERLSVLLEDFVKLTGIRITFWRSDGKKCVSGTKDGDCAFCHRLQSVPALKQACQRYDSEALASAVAYRRSVELPCHAGLEECAYPVVHGDRLLGFFMIGQVRIEDGPPLALRRSLLESHGFDFEELDGLYRQIPIITREKRRAAIRMLDALAGFIYNEQLVRHVEMPLVEEFERYVKANLNGSLPLAEVCKALHVSPSTLSHTVKEKLEMTAVQYINRQRVESVRLSLMNGETISYAASRAGFSSASYCSRMFLRESGMRPEAYREMMCKQKNP